MYNLGEAILMSYTEVTRVCPDEQVNLTCISNGSLILRWDIDIPLPPNSAKYDRNVPITGDGMLTPIPHPISNGTVNFNFFRISEANTHPLISELMIDRVTVELNGTEINCSTSVPVDEVIMTAVLLVLGPGKSVECSVSLLNSA